MEEKNLWILGLVSLIIGVSASLIADQIGQKTIGFLLVLLGFAPLFMLFVYSMYIRWGDYKAD